MSDDKYLQAIDEAQRLITTLLNDPEHGKLTFKGANGLDDLTIAGPCDLNDFMPGAVVIIDQDECGWPLIPPHSGRNSGNTLMACNGRQAVTCTSTPSKTRTTCSMPIRATEGKGTNTYGKH